MAFLDVDVIRKHVAHVTEFDMLVGKMHRTITPAVCEAGRQGQLLLVTIF